MDEVPRLKGLICGFLKKKVRVDNRKFLQGRKPFIALSKTPFVQLGYTAVTAEVNYNVTLPVSSNPAEGILRMNVTTGRALHEQTMQKIQLSLESCIRDSKAVNLKSLCIIPGCRVWEIEVCIDIIAHDGNLVECASIAAVSALACLTLPQVKYEICDGEVIVEPIHEMEPVSLNFNFIPMCISLGLFDQNKYILVDPTKSEAVCCDSIYTVCMNVSKEICNVEEEDFLLLEADMQKCVLDVAIKRAQEITHQIRALLDSRNNGYLLDSILLNFQNVTV